MGRTRQQTFGILAMTNPCLFTMVFLGIIIYYMLWDFVYLNVTFTTILKYQFFHLLCQWLNLIILDLFKFCIKIKGKMPNWHYMQERSNIPFNAIDGNIQYGWRGTKEMFYFISQKSNFYHLLSKNWWLLWKFISLIVLSLLSLSVTTVFQTF